MFVGIDAEYYFLVMGEKNNAYRFFDNKDLVLDPVVFYKQLYEDLNNGYLEPQVKLSDFDKIIFADSVLRTADYIKAFRDLINKEIDLEDFNEALENYQQLPFAFYQGFIIFLSLVYKLYDIDLNNKACFLIEPDYSDEEYHITLLTDKKQEIFLGRLHDSSADDPGGGFIRKYFLWQLMLKRAFKKHTKTS
jgi:hypothetical protein